MFQNKKQKNKTILEHLLLCVLFINDKADINLKKQLQ